MPEETGRCRATRQPKRAFPREAKSSIEIDTVLKSIETMAMPVGELTPSEVHSIA